jgi:hypothetical protein
MRLLAVGFLLCAGATASAQGRWKKIGKTSAGNPVFVDPKTVKTANGITSARVRVKFVKPVSTPEGQWKSSQSAAMFDCAKQKIAVKENVYYADDEGHKVIERNVAKIPGYGPTLDGTMAQIALDYFCKKK